MKANIWLLALSVGFILSLRAQFPNPTDFNTATNSTNSGTLGVGSNDLHWSVALTNSAGPYIPAVSCGYEYTGWIPSSSPNANWISYPHTCVPNSPAEHSCLNPASQDVFYKLAVNLPTLACGSVSTSGTYCLNLDLYADNCIYEVFVNGGSKYLTTSSNPYYDYGFSPGNNVIITLCDNWLPGNNSVIIHVKSGAGSAPTWEALLATATQTVNTGNLGSLNINVNHPSGISCAGAVLTFTAGGATNYTWQPGNLSGPTVTVFPFSSTTYTVIGTSPTCNGSTSFTQNIKICEGLMELNLFDMNIFPNPTPGLIELYNIKVNSDIELFNSMGDRIYQCTSNKEEISIDLSTYSKGIYFIKISFGNSSVYKKIIKD